jgi:hypothetical protein
LTVRVTTPGRTLLGLASRSEVCPGEVTPVWVKRSHLAVSRFLGFAVSPRRDPPEAFNTKLATPLFELGLRLEPHPTTPSRPPEARSAPLLGFRSLQHMRIRRSTSRGLSLPTSFRPQGLATLSTVCSLRTPAGLVSYRRRSWDFPFGVFPSRKVRGRFRPRAPTYRFT